MILDSWLQPQLAAVRRISVKKSVEKAAMYISVNKAGIIGIRVCIGQYLTMHIVPPHVEEGSYSHPDRFRPGISSSNCA